VPAADRADLGGGRIADPGRVECRGALGGGALAQFACRGRRIAVQARLWAAAQRLDRVAQVAEQLAVLPAHHLRAQWREEPAAGQVGRDPFDRRVGPRGVAADPQQPGLRHAVRRHFARRDVRGGEPHAHPVDVPEPAQREALVGHPVLRADDRQVLARGAAARHRSPGPVGEHRDGVLRLRRYDQDVILSEVDLFRPADRQRLDRVRARWRAEPEPVVAHGFQVRPAGDQNDLVPRQGQTTADRAADRTRIDDDVPHAPDFPTADDGGAYSAPKCAPLTAVRPRVRPWHGCGFSVMKGRA
jgi:hypothetical protein